MSTNFFEKLSMGELPDEINYTKSNSNQTIDWDKVRYQSFYRTFDFQAQRLPQGWESIAGFDKVIQKLADTAKTPLEELETRQAKKESLEQILDEQQ